MSVAVSIRRADSESDLAFFMSIALRSNYALFAPNRQVPWHVYKHEHRKVFERLFKRQGSVLMIACEESDPSFILGCALGDPGASTLHYAYVKKSLRKFGVFSRLMIGLSLNLTDCIFSHWSRDMALITRARKSASYFNPYVQFPEEGEP